MSIITKTGDDGTTALMYNRRVPKSDPRVEAYGTVDELNTALGMARSVLTDEALQNQVLAVQKDLVTVMGELATLPQDRERYVKDGYGVLSSAMTSRLEQLAGEIEAEKIPFKGWATPGANTASAALELARTITRRAERRVCRLQETQQLGNPEILIYLNRLSDFLWLAARRIEHQQASGK